jgi:hypothetical protein
MRLFGTRQFSKANESLLNRLDMSVCSAIFVGPLSRLSRQFSFSYGGRYRNYFAVLRMILSTPWSFQMFIGV